MVNNQPGFLEGLTHFVECYIHDNGIKANNLELKSLTGDAGFRKYFRCTSSPSMIAVFSPPETEKNIEFCSVADFLRGIEVTAPKVLKKDLEQGFMLLEDFGDDLLLDALSETSVDRYYRQAFDVLTQMQKSEPAGLGLPNYDRSLLTIEMDLFDDWYLVKLLGLSVSASELSLINATKQLLVDSALSQSQGFVHRDFHARNLMRLDNDVLGVIDFQDAVIGPLTYDLVSLLKDCYVRWPRARVEAWALEYAADLRQHGMINLDDESFLKAFHFMGLQRHLKVLGIFARLFLRDQKARYLDDLPRVMAYILEVTEMYAELASFGAYLRECVLPSARQKGRA